MFYCASPTRIYACKGEFFAYLEQKKGPLSGAKGASTKNGV